MKAFKLVFFSLGGLFVIIYFLIIGYLYFNQQDIVFKASKLPTQFQFQFSQTFKELNIPSFDGNKLNGLLFETPQSKGLVFYLHGNAGNIETWGNIAQIYTNLGYDIFILDYRGFGKSEGTIENESQVLKDATVAYQYLLKKYNEQKVIIMGYSIGTGIAAYLTANNNPKALILQAPYYNFTQLTSDMVPYMPNFLKKFNFPTNEFLKKVKSPVYIFHGNQDHLINCNNSIKLNKLLPNNSHLFILNNQGHVGINENQEFLDKLKLILK